MSKLLITLGGDDILKIKNKVGMRPHELCTDTRLKLEL